MRELIRQGIDPIERQRAAQSALRAAVASALTFRRCAESYMQVHEAGWKNAKHAQQWRNTLDQYAYPVIGDLLVRDIEKSHVLQILRPIWISKTETASRLRGRIELVLSYAMQAGYRPDGLNPARWRGGLDKLLPAPSKVAKAGHHPAVPVGEVGEFMEQLRAADGMGARALEFVLLTAARSGEVRGALWPEFDLREKVWTIPAERMKAGREHRVPLSDAALALLTALPRDAGNELVFPGPKGGALSDMTLTAVMRRMGMAAVPHGLRSTFRDWAAERTKLPARGCGNGPGPRHRRQGGSSVPARRLVRETGPDDGGLGCLPGSTGAGCQRDTHQAATGPVTLVLSNEFHRNTVSMSPLRKAGLGRTGPVAYWLRCSHTTSHRITTGQQMVLGPARIESCSWAARDARQAPRMTAAPRASMRIRRTAARRR